MGRYHLWHLHPFTLSELPKGVTPAEGLKRLLRVGGFPEPFLDNDERSARRWRQERLEKVIKEDIRDRELVKNIQGMQLLVALLRERVGSPVVISNLAEDLQVSPVTVKKWIEILESMYVIFQVRPYSRQMPRALQKQPKIYFYDNADVRGDEGALFENLVATHLLKALQFAQDYSGHVYELYYIRDKEKREVDFLVVKDGRPIEMMEVKWADTQVAPSLVYYADKLKIPVGLQ
jgi:predicted AAA+ superfamily ATPase